MSSPPRERGGPWLTPPPRSSTAPAARWRRLRRRLRRPRTILFGGLGLFVLLAVIVIVRYLPAIDALQQGRDDVLKAEAILRSGGVDLRHDQATAATTLLEEARRDFSTGSSIIADGWVANIASHLPLLDRHVATVRDLREAGESGADLALTMIPVLEDVRQAAGGAGTGLVGRLISLAGSHTAELTRAQSDLDQLDRVIGRLPDGWLIGPVDHMRSAAQEARTRVVGPARAAIGITRALPLVAGSGQHRYLLLLTNPGEERGGGGFIGAVGAVTFQDGVLTSTTFMPSGFSDALVTDIPAPKPIRAITGTNLALADADWSPDFPTSAVLAERIYTRATGKDLDGVVNVDPVALSYVVRVIGGVHVPPYPQVVTADNALLELNYIINNARPGDPGKAYLAPFGHAMVDAIFKSGASQWAGVASALGRGVQERHIVLFFNDPQLESLARSGAAGGLLGTPPGDSVLVADSNLSGTKGDLYVTRHFDLSATVDAAGYVQDRLTLTYRNPVVTTAADAALLTDSGGLYDDYVRVYLPGSATLDDLQVSDNGAPADSESPEDLGAEAGRQWVAFRLIVEPGKTQTVTFIYHGRFAQPAADGRVSYSLSWQKQLNALPWEASIEVHLANGHTDQWSGSLSCDQRREVS